MAAASGPARPGRFQRWLASRTLRGRLVAGVVGLLALACAAVGVATYTALHGYLLRQLDSQVMTAAQFYGECLHHPARESDSGENGKPARPPPNSPESCAEQQAPHAFTAQFRNGTLSSTYVAVPNGDNGRYKLSPADKAGLAGGAASGAPFTTDLSTLGSYRLVAMPSESPGVAYLAGLPTSGLDATLGTIVIVEVVGFAAALALTGVLGTAYVRLSLRPLRRVAATATRVTELPLASGEVSLTERVPDTNPRTEVGQVGAALNRMLGHVESALGRRAASEARLRRFAADASHELRTPLAAIRGYAEFARHHPGPMPSDIAHALNRVESESARMSVLVDELLLLAQLDAGRPLAEEPVDLTRLAIDATSDARAAGPQHRWQLELPDEPVMVRGDEHRLRQVLANLVSNAAKHTPAGTTVTIALALDQPGNAVELSVTDDGPGISPELLPTLFERFVRGDSARTRAEGSRSTGLGLAIVDAVTTAHGGGVSVSSRPGRTRFVISLPALQPGPGPDENGARPGRLGTRQPAELPPAGAPPPPATPR